MAATALIVGGGIGGGVLATLLVRAGWSVTILERTLAGDRLPVRPEILWPATVQVLFSLAAKAEWAEAMLPLQGIEFSRDRKPLFRVTPETFHRAGVQPWSTDPAATRAQVLALAACEVLHGMEAVGMLRDGSRIAGVCARDVTTGAEREFPADWIIGDDGAHSAVRAACGITIEARRFPVEFFCFGFDWPEELPAGAVRGFTNPEQSTSAILALGAMPLPRGKGAGLVPVHGARFDEGANIAAEWERFVGSDPLIPRILGTRRFPDDFTRVKRDWGHAEHYGVPGALLMGDAAHPVSPAGGQGANMSIHDARALADVLLAGERDVVSEYERRRRPANERSLGFTRAAVRFFRLRERGGLRAWLAGGLAVLVRQRWFVAQLLRRAASASLGQ